MAINSYNNHNKDTLPITIIIIDYIILYDDADDNYYH